MMAKLTFCESTVSALEEKGYVSVCEPTCGSGVMITSFCKSMKEAGFNYCNQMVATAIDIDAKCAHMTYLQLSLYGVPAVVIHGNSLTLESWSRWYTPIYLLNGWIWRDGCTMTSAPCAENEMIKCALEPTYAAMRQVEKLIADTNPAAEANQPKINALDAEVRPLSVHPSRDVERYQAPTNVATKPKKQKPPLPTDIIQPSLFDV